MSALPAILVAIGGTLLYLRSSNQQIMRRPLPPTLALGCGICAILIGMTVLAADTSLCTACLMTLTLLMIVWCLLPLAASLRPAKRPSD